MFNTFVGFGGSDDGSDSGKTLRGHRADPAAPSLSTLALPPHSMLATALQPPPLAPPQPLQAVGAGAGALASGMGAGAVAISSGTWSPSLAALDDSSAVVLGGGGVGGGLGVGGVGGGAGVSGQGATTTRDGIAGSSDLKVAILQELLLEYAMLDDATHPEKHALIDSAVSLLRQALAGVEV
jgi:hypothetical protein